MLEAFFPLLPREVKLLRLNQSERNCVPQLAQSSFSPSASTRLRLLMFTFSRMVIYGQSQPP